MTDTLIRERMRIAGKAEKAIWEVIRLRNRRGIPTKVNNQSSSFQGAVVGDCPECDAPLHGGWEFCPWCGQALKWEEE